MFGLGGIPSVKIAITLGKLIGLLLFCHPLLFLLLFFLLYIFLKLQPLNFVCILIGDHNGDRCPTLTIEDGSILKSGISLNHISTFKCDDDLVMVEKEVKWCQSNDYLTRFKRKCRCKQKVH